MALDPIPSLPIVAAPKIMRGYQLTNYPNHRKRAAHSTRSSRVRQGAP